MRHPVIATWVETMCLENLLAEEMINHKSYRVSLEEQAVYGCGKMLGDFGREEARSKAADSVTGMAMKSTSG